MDHITVVEAQRFTELEAIMARTRLAFYEFGDALLKIRDERLYRANYPTFEEYCQRRWGMVSRHANRLIEAAVVVEDLGPIGLTLDNESQARALAKLPPELRGPILQEAAETAPNGHVTARHIESTANGFNYKRDAQRSRKADRDTPQGMDACQTPAYAIDPLLPYLGDWVIWEPAAGEGLLVKALYDSGFRQSQVVYGDLLAGQNFFDYQPDRWDCLITNPPYSIQFDWLKRCYELDKPFALLLKVEVLGTKQAQKLFAGFGVEVIFVSPRINFKMPNKGWDGAGAQFAVAWFTHGLFIGQQMTFVEIKAASK